MKERILQYLLDSSRADGERVPSVRSLMCKFDAASATVQAALSELRKKKLIYSVVGKGTFWGDSPKLDSGNSKMDPPALNPAESLTAQFSKDFRSGFFRNGTLPSLKEMMARYAVSRAELGRFLENEKRKNVLGRNGKCRYYFVENSPMANSCEILFVTRADRWGNFIPASEREQDFIRLVYKTAAASNLKIDLLGFDAERNRLMNRNGNARSLHEFQDAVGVIVSTLLLMNPAPLLEMLAPLRIPVAVWWEHPEDFLPTRFLQKEHFAFFNSTFGKMPGVEVGKFLLRKGLRKVLYVSPFHSSSWSLDRLSGLCESGIEVVARTDAQYASPWDFSELARQSGNPETVRLRARKLIARKLRNLVRDVPEVDAAVCVNDEVASILLDLRNSGLAKIPEYLVGFDNSAESYLLRLDSYDFNTETLVRLLFDHLMTGNGNPFSSRSFCPVLGSVAEK